ncbi:pyruvate dehydrogenase (acetyl-transferring) E1 component subunit alpha [Haloglycomyces albus]|uniref:pyruvate dehydrogenase (acetyl-transferring) E1 component subunit alpha n=1 Tax=Haloglycomyces albus TaxID=526067 RepID=UPI00046CF291|nr:pyruvate dehydrogenase (acetyl-transferring) E1 component subunit alpha [Haloglycomyces albus]
MGTGEDSPRPSKKKAANRRQSSTSGTNSPQFVQIITPEGKRVKKPEFDVKLSDDEYRSLYRDLVISRELDAQGTALQRQGHLGLWPSMLGQEGAQIGSGRALGPNDKVFPSYRELGVQWAKGLDIISAFSLFRGVDLGGRPVEDDKFNMYEIVIAAQTLHATGYAMGITKDGAVGNEDGEAVITYHGDGATSQGDFNESLVFASVYDAPIVFFCQNNQYAISEPVTTQSKVALSQRGDGFGIDTYRVDGNDVLACYAVTQMAMQRARMGEGPALIEAVTYRMAPHTTSDDATRYRGKDEEEEWRAKDPITRYRAWLKAEGLADDEFFDAIDTEADEEVRRLRDRVINMPNPDVSSMFDHVYVNNPQDLEQQRQEAVEFRDSLEEGSDA